LPVFVALAREHEIDVNEVLSGDLRVRFEELLAQEGVPNLLAARARADATVARLEAIADHANRQADGVWPKS
jgi:hypothetical protein